jgi:hypothetical protein
MAKNIFVDQFRRKIFKSVTKEIQKLNKLDHNGIFLTDRELEIITLIALEFGGKR